MASKQERIEQLRRRAEAFLATSRSSPESPGDLQALLHEHHVHQVELEFQNDELTQTQLELQESRDSYRALFEGAPIGYMVLDPEGYVLQANQPAATLLSTEREALIERRLQVFVSNPRDLPTLNQHLEQSFGCAELQECELLFRRGDGVVHLRLHTQAVRTEPGQPARCRAALIDISAQWAAEEAQRKLNQALKERTQSLEDALQAAQILERRLVEAERLEAVGRLAGGVAHDFNNMLTVISGVAHCALAKLPADSHIRESFEQILLAGERSAKLTAQLLAFGRRQFLTPEPTDLVALVQETCLLLDASVGSTAKVVFTPPAERVAAKVDGAGLQQALLNLAFNARDAMPRGGRVHLSLQNLEWDERAAALQPDTVPGRYAVLSVRDEGVGLDPEHREQIFEPFFTTKAGGTGLGLASVHGYVAQSGGFIRVDSVLAQGTTFHVHLPAVEPTPGVSAPGAPAPLAARRTVLLVDDEPLLRGLFTEILSGAGLEVVSAGSGEEALRLCRQRPQPVDLALLDVLMPEMNGVDLAEHLHALVPDCRFIFMSGFAAADLVQRIGKGISGPLLQKPLSSKRLLLEVQRVIAR